MSRPLNMNTANIYEMVQQSSGYQFRDEKLLLTALTHRSFVNENPGAEHNERLEFLGDAFLGWVAARLLFERDESASEGLLTKRRADLIRESSFCDIAMALNLGEALRIGRGEEKTGGRTRPRLLASALEALVAAVYLDGGLQEALHLAERLLQSQMPQLANDLLDPKSRLQETLQAASKVAPTYRVESTRGKDHEKIFVVVVDHLDRECGRGEGRSKAQAEQAAATDALIKRGETMPPRVLSEPPPSDFAIDENATNGQQDRE